MRYPEPNRPCETKKELVSSTDSPRLADGSIPILPVIIEASSDKISPNILFVTIVSNCKKLYIHTFVSPQILWAYSGLEWARNGMRWKKNKWPNSYKIEQKKPVLDYERAALLHCQHTCEKVQHQDTLRQLPSLSSSIALMPVQFPECKNTHKFINEANVFLPTYWERNVGLYNLRMLLALWAF